MYNEKYKVLMIEDDKLDQAAFKRLVETEGLQYDYTIAGSIAEARNILACQQFDIIIADYLLGSGTAFDILDLVKNTPIVVVTGTGNEEIAVKAWRAGAYDYLTKDIERSYLKTLPITVENAIRHKRAEENLQLLSGAIMSTVDSVYITDMEDKITFVNKALCDTYGYKREEILGKNSSVLWLAGHKKSNTRTVFRTQGIGDSWEIGFYHRRKNGSMFPVSISRSIIKDSNGNKIAVVGTVRDITERILIEDELRRTNLKLKEQDKLKSELVIKTLKTLIKLLTNENILDNPEQKNNMWEKLDTAKRLTNDFLDILRIDTGRLKLQPVKKDLGEMISELIKEMSILAAKKDIELKSTPPDFKLTVNAEHDMLVRALTNILDYAINVTPPKSRIEVRLKDAGSEIEVEFRNGGTLVEGGNSNKLFNCFELIKEQPGWNLEQDGALGLSIAKKIIEIHGGWIWAEATEDDRRNNLCISLPKSTEKETIMVNHKKEQSCEIN